MVKTRPTAVSSVDFTRGDDPNYVLDITRGDDQIGYSDEGLLQFRTESEAERFVVPPVDGDSVSNHGSCEVPRRRRS